jgi:hypothetical protein
MAFLSSLDGPQVGAVRVLALVAGATASAVPGVAPAAAISIAPDQAPLPQFSGRTATIAIGNPACGRGWAQRDPGRYSV